MAKVWGGNTEETLLQCHEKDAELPRGGDLPRVSISIQPRVQAHSHILDDATRSAPEITLRNIQTDDGEGYLRLLRLLIPESLPLGLVLVLP